MKKTLTLRSKNILGLSTILFTLLFAFSSKQANAQAGFTTLGFPGGYSQPLAVCQDAIATNIDGLLTVFDPATGNTLNWSVLTTPTHGSLSLSGYVATSTGADITPSGWTYTPTGGYSGSDVFVVQIFNGTDTSTTTINVTVNPLPSVGPITGVLHECVGLTTTLSNSVSGGTWVSSNPSVATISSSGVVTGLTVGTTTIIYNVTDGATGCTNNAFAVDTVLSIPVVPAITGSTTVCVTGSTSLSNSMSGGTWASSNLARATVNGSGTVFGVSTGAVTISYSVTNSCGTGRNTLSMTVEGNTVAAITPASAVSVCVGATTTLANATTGGTWSSVDNSIATVNSSGVVTGVSSGTVNIVYTLVNSCGTNSVTKSVTVNDIPAVPSSIGGTLSACVGSTTTLTSATSGGTWTSANNTIASVNAGSGTARANSGGSTTITYTVFNSCGSNFTTAAFTSLTVPAAPAAIFGPTSLCVGSTTTMTDATSSGLWSSSNLAVASIEATTGVVYGLTLGTFTVSYTVTNSCGSTSAILLDTVTNTPTAPAPIGGATSVCVGSTITLTDGTPSGTWSSGTTSVATISNTGVVTGLTTGSTLISYSVTNFCGTSAATTTIVVNTVPSAPGVPTGPSSVCVGSSTAAFTDASSGGTWSSSNNAVATINPSTGVAFGVGVGTVNISYTVSNSCGSASDITSLSVITVPTVPAIGGTTSMCVGATSTLTNSTGGGVWSSSNTGVATVSTTGGVFGVSAGSANISYAVTNVCGTTTRSTSVTIVAPPPTPASISGSNQVCVGSTTTLTDASTGSWSSSNTAVATISNAGVVLGLSTGSVNITFTSTNACGSTFVTFAMTVLTVPTVNAIGGPNNVCIGDTIVLTQSATGGTWSSTNATIASVNASGTVRGNSVGSVNISYTSTNICGTTARGKTVNVGTLPATPTLSGATSTCAGTSVTQISSGGGTWSSSNTAVASINAATGSLFGITGGTVTITNSITNACGTTTTTRSFTVTTVPVIGAIGGTSPMCVGTTATFTDTTVSGTWSTSNPAVVSVVAATGFVTAVGVGTANINYTKANSCGANSASFSVTVVTVPATPAAITGTASVCIGATTVFSSTTSGGVWSSSNTAIATVDGSGNVYGVSGGSANISYTMVNSCGSSTPRTRAVTVNTPPSVAAITGTATACIGANTTLSDATGGGVWSSSDATIASVNAATGRVDGIAVGTATISYTVTNGCGSTSALRSYTVTTVPPTPNAITGTLTACVGGSSGVSSTTSGGAWSTSNAGVASVNGSGTVFGVSGGTATITYTSTNTCGSTFTTATFTVTTVPPAPPAITGASTVCAGDTTSFYNTTAGGVWTSSLPGVATVNSSTGLITGITAGSATTISYTVTNGCGSTSVTKGLSVITLPVVAAIGGSTTLCQGAFVDLTNATGGGTWTTSDATVASVHPTSGRVFGISGTPSGATATITYSVTNACGTTTSTRVVTVLSTPTPPSAISGPDSFCLGASSSVTSSPGGGVWTSSNTGVATVHPTTGALTSVALGTTTITYTVSNTCGPSTATKTVRVITLPTVAPITGPGLECVGSSITMSNATPGGTWSSSNPAIANVSTGGVVTGVSVGTVLIIYTVTNICGTTIRTANDTVISGTVASITGSSNVCIGSTTTLSSATTGGTWSSSNFTIATVNPSTGAVFGVSGGSATITYSVTTACGTNTATRAITVDVSGVGAISGPASVCEGSTITLTNPTSGGVWTSLTPTIATIGAATGIVTGVSAGTASIQYTVTNSCGTFSAFSSGTVNPVPVEGTIFGTTSVCEVDAITLTNSASGGTWSSSSTTIATISTGGVVSGNVTGSVTISYQVTNGCGTATATHPVSVNALPVAGTISGPTDVCVGSTIALTDAASGGSWSSSATTVASVDASTGVVYGLSAGSATITYTVTNGCGTATATYAIDVRPLPVVVAIAGTTPICEASNTLYTNATAGGVWTTSNAAVASVDGSGTVYGVSGGTANISYTVTSVFSCVTTVTQTITINPLPDAGTITGGTSVVCEGSSITLTGGTAGGTWSSSGTANASVSTSGVVTGVTAGPDTIYYSFTNSCGTDVASYPITVNPLPHAGTLSARTNVICELDTLQVSSTIGGGSWSSASTTTATISSGGLVTGRTAGSTTISYSFTNSCGTDVATFALTVNPLPDAGTISGSVTVCVAANTTLSSTVSGGTWSSSSTGNASVNAAGVVTGITAGSDTIYYSFTNSCGTDVSAWPITVLPLPNAGTIVGLSVVCEADSITLGNASVGGTWSSSLPSTATVTTGGVVYGVTAGVVTISYTVINSCGTAVTTHSVTVNPLPHAGTVVGPTSVCVGMPASFTSSIGGGIWRSGTTSVATIDTVTGLVTALTAGTTIITYSVTNSCGVDRDTALLTVLPLPNAGTITGPSIVCEGSNITLSNSTSFGTPSWTSVNIAIATVNAAGVVRGVAPGVDTIVYRVTTASCGSDSTRFVVTVNPLPHAGVITGPLNVCINDSVTLIDTSGSGAGTWDISPLTTADFGTGTGVVIGRGAGTATVSYMVTNSCGTDTAFRNITVNSLPDAGTIAGSTTVCIGSNITLTTSGSGGAWTSSNPSIAPVNSVTGVVSGSTAGTVTISYIATSTFCGRDTAVYTVTVVPAPTAGTIFGPTSVCVGSSIFVGDTTGTTIGTWSTTTPAIIGVTPYGGDSATITGSTAGTGRITYTVTTACGTARVSYTVSVITVPSAGTISGTTTLCVGTTAILTSSGTAGGRWSSSNASIATIDTASGLVTAISGGTATITYSVSNACGTVTATAVITVNPLPDPGVITPGSFALCQGDSTTLIDTTSGGSWSSSASGIANVTAVGVVHAVAAGTATISYCKTNSCGTRCATSTITVNPLPRRGAITGPTTVCVAAFINLSNPTGTAGGAWSSSDVSTAVINASTGRVTGVRAGTVTISYIVTTATCGSDTAYYTVTVLPLPNADTITGPSTVCTGTNITLIDTASGGTWSSSAPTIASVNASGIVSGISAGSAIISYTVTNSCGTDYATHAVTVYPSPVAGTILGPTRLCPGGAAAVTLTYTGTAGGRWSSSVATIATIDTLTGRLEGVTAGVVTITYSYTSPYGCGTITTSRTDTVDPAPSAGVISGPSSLCDSSSISLVDTAAGGFGSWSTASFAIATVDASGVVTGRSPGTTTISYSVTNSCGTATATHGITVLRLPSSGTISGATSICEGASTAYTISGAYGSSYDWSTSDATIASVDAVTGSVYGVSMGTTTITYTSYTASCGSRFTTRSITVNPLPLAGSISGPTNVCQGASITLSISGTTYATGGSWSGGSPYASVGATTGIVTGSTTAAGVAIITYTSTNACGSRYTTYAVTVDPLARPGSIVGRSYVCYGDTIHMSNPSAVGSGSWTTAASTIVNIDAAGVVTGVGVGTTTITYTATTVCSSTIAVMSITVDPLPSAGTISGYSGPFCQGDSILLSSTVSGGTWSSLVTAIAGVGATSGYVTGRSGGTTRIVYTVTSARCGSDTTSVAVTINPLPGLGAISAPNHICLGSVTTISTPSYYGATSVPGWSSSNPAVVSVSSGGVMTGVALGSAIISFGVTNACGTVWDTMTVTVHALPNPGVITGMSPMCVTTTSVYTSSGSTGGTWSSSAIGIASVEVGTGRVWAMSPGTATITYSVTAAYCGTNYDTIVVSVLAPPVASAIVGVDTICEASSTTYMDSVSGGSWSSSNPSIASVNPASGYVIGVAPGTAIIYYTIVNMCGTDVRSKTIVVRPLPHAGTIVGSSALCVGTPVTFTSSTTGGRWYATNSVATVTSIGGVVSGMVPGNDTIYYVVSNSCGTDTSVKVVTVNVLPHAGFITAARNWVCQGDSLLLNNVDTGGFWTTSNSAIGALSSMSSTVSPSRAMVVGFSAGLVIITYNFVNYCGTATDTIAITVRPADHCYDDVATVAPVTEVGIYPNPAVNTLHIDAPVVVNVTVVSPDGKVVIEQKAATDIDVSALANGLYMIMIYDQNNSLLKASKFVKAQ